MLDFFASVPGKLKTLTDRLTPARAGYLDNLNTNLAVLPAPASTALSTALWTNGRAANLDLLSAGGIAQETTPILDVPIASGLALPGPYAQGRILAGHLHSSVSGPGLLTTASTTYVDVLNYTGQGVLSFLAIAPDAAVAPYLKLVIDGVTIFTDFGPSAIQYACRAAVGTISGTTSDPVISIDAIPFKTSLQIQAKIASSTAYVTVLYRKTA
jgi:hypothetical protein